MTFKDGEITTIDLSLQAEVPDITKDKLKEIATKAKEVCPVSKLFKADINLSILLK